MLAAASRVPTCRSGFPLARSWSPSASWTSAGDRAFVPGAYERNVERLLSKLESRDAVAAMRTYADEVDARAAELKDPDAQAAREWADWIRQHAECTDPLNGPLRIAKVTSCSHEELQPHMNGWSTYGPYRS